MMCRLASVVLLLIIMMQEGIAQDVKGIRVHGFLSQGYLKSTGNNDVFGNSSGNGSFDFREIGANASYRPLPNLQFSGQLLSRSAGEDSKGGIRIDYGFVDYTAISTESMDFGIRLGRTKNPLGFYNDTRDVPFTRPSILLPQSIYFDRTRNLGLASDGAQIYGESRNSWGDLNAQFGVVFPQAGDRSTEFAILQADRPGGITPHLSYIGRLIYEYDGGRVRLALSGAQVNTGYDAAQVDPFSGLGSFQFTPIIFSAQYNTERWSLTSEYAIRHIERYDFANRSARDLNLTGESYYFQGIYRFSPNWEGVLRYDAYYADRSDRDGKDFAKFIQIQAPDFQDNFPSYSRFAKDITVGLRWNVTPSIMLRAEYHYINGTGWISSLDNRAPNTTLQRFLPAITDQHWNLFAFQASYRF
ncbi:MAG TPA: hypothetical protein PKD44_07335 [Nitrosomonas sp.]|nr:hypothetical protein [Nitrosomonas sp.]HNC40904.1 hypothetical protein [Nitrosomonas sp.]HNH68274.1 hypothetical protein [Nitrosomonas sp.]HNK88646.1 hypothetical protein [Nitrosomonas sp.]HNM72161.1 hypothetical protein [Nitrosomonas sp.]